MVIHGFQKTFFSSSKDGSKMVSMVAWPSFNTLLKLDRKQIAGAASVFALCIQDDPVIRYLSAGKATLHDITNIVRYILDLSLDSYSLYSTSPDLEALALWLPGQTDQNLSLFQKLQRAVRTTVIHRPPRYYSRMASVYRPINEIKKERLQISHVVLELLAVSGEFQGKGYASKLLNPMLDYLDQQGLGCFLGCTLERNVCLYRHFGFEVLVESNIPDTNIIIYSMLRLPQTPK